MFCPVCHAEYRQGFTQCVDCGVNLVPYLSDGAASADKTSHLLWSGVDPRFFKALSHALDEAGIEYNDEPAGSQLLSAIRSDAFQVRVRGTDFEAAKKVLADLGESNSDVDDGTTFDSRATHQSWLDPFGFAKAVIKRVADNNPGKDEPEPEGDGEVPEDFVENFDPEESTVVVWTGEDWQMANIFQECLSNVGIGCVLNTNMGKTQVLVTPAAEKRAREVVREIEEGTPMQ